MTWLDVFCGQRVRKLQKFGVYNQSIPKPRKVFKHIYQYIPIYTKIYQDIPKYTKIYQYYHMPTHTNIHEHTRTYANKCLKFWGCYKICRVWNHIFTYFVCCMQQNCVILHHICIVCVIINKIYGIWVFFGTWEFKNCEIYVTYNQAI